VKVFTWANRKVREFHGGAQPAGIFDIKMEAKDTKGAPLANGVYYIVVESSAGDRKVVKLAVLR